MKLSELCGEALHPAVYRAWDQAGIAEALPVQETAVRAGLFEGAPLLVIAPTSSGKTFLGEMLALARATSGSRAIYLVPFKAIAEERFSEFTSRYSDNPELGFRCIVSDRDHHESDADLLHGKYDVAILTYEKLTALLVANQAILNTCGSVIIDEVQLIGDETRGPGLELLLTKLRSLSDSCQILALSAVLGDLNKFDEWLGCKVIRENVRPIELRAGIVAPGGKFEFREFNSGAKGVEAFSSNNVASLNAFFVNSGDQVLIFTSTVKRTVELAHELAGKLGLPAATSAIKVLSDEADTETREGLLKTLRNGIAFHNADCELPERLIVEQGFRAGDIKVLVSTTTLSMGVNLPVDNVILADNKKWTVVAGSFTQVPWRTAEVKNILGRAGRLGKSKTFGRGLLLGDSQAEVIQCQNLYINAAVEPLKSALGDKNIDERVLTVIASGYAREVGNVHTFLFDTFAGLKWSSGKAAIAALIEQGIKQCETLELIEIQAGGEVKPTPLGCVCAGNHLVYNSSGVDLERAVTELFNVGFAKCHAQRIEEQRSGEPDLILLLDSGQRLTVQITAKESNTKYVDSKKAGDVIPQSARYSADGFVCIGRPDFETLAREQAGHLAVKYNYKQLPVFILAECFVMSKEGRMSAEDTERFILHEKGYLSLERLRSLASVVAVPFGSGENGTKIRGI